MIISLSLLATLFVAAARASNVIDLDPTNFDSVVGTGKPALVEFFAPWCGHCKSLAPIYEELADAFSHRTSDVVVAKVDADGAGRELGQKYGVTGFPTLKWFGPEGGEPEAYNGGRDLDALASFITEKTGIKSSIKPPPPPATVILTAHDFDEVVNDESKDVLVTFTAPWCGHCKNMKPIYEKVATTFLPETNCVVANVDADAKVNAALAEKFQVASFPTIKFFPKENKDGEAYEGGRSEKDFVEFLNKRCGTHRAVGGGLNDNAGRLHQLDELASSFFAAAKDARHAIYDEALLVAGKIGEGSQHYLRVMQKVINGTEDYVSKESKRLASILKKRTLAPAKLDEIKIKANILSQFAEKSDDVDATEEGHAKDEL